MEMVQELRLAATEWELEWLQVSVLAYGSVLGLMSAPALELALASLTARALALVVAAASALVLVLATALVAV